MKKAFILVKEVLFLFHFWRWLNPQNYQQISPVFKPKSENIININH